jgi:hypothetical protein
MSRFTSLVNLPVSGKTAAILNGMLLMPGTTQGTDLGLAIPVTGASPATLGQLKGAHATALDSLQNGTVWTYREVELQAPVQLERFDYSQATADTLSVTSASGTTVTITSLQNNADCGWLYAVSGTGAGLLAFCTAINGGTATTKTATGWDSTTKVIHIHRFGHTLVTINASGQLKTQAAVGTYTVFNFENYIESTQGGLAGNLLDPTKHDNQTFTRARFYSRMSVRAHAGF